MKNVRDQVNMYHTCCLAYVSQHFQNKSLSDSWSSVIYSLYLYHFHPIIKVTEWEF